MEYDFKNKALTHITAAISAVALTLPIFPGDYSSVLGGTEPIMMILRGPEYREIVKVDPGTSSWSNYLTVERGQGGTIARAWPSGTLLFASTTADAYNNMEQTGQNRIVDYNPNQILAPYYKGEKIYQSGPAGCERWWKSWDGINPYWDLITGVKCGAEGYEDIGWNYDILIAAAEWSLEKDLSLEGDPQAIISAMAVNPTNGVIIAGTQYGGELWKSTDGGYNWTKKKDLSLETPAQGKVWAAAYDSFHDVFAVGTDIDGQLWVSGDDGETWTLKKDLSNESPAQNYVYSLAYDSTNHVLVAGTAANAQIWTSGDGGETWWLRKTIRDSGNEVFVYALAYDSVNDIMYAGTGDNKAQIWKSTNGSVTWTLAVDLNAQDSGNNRVYSLGYDPTNDVIMAGVRYNARVYTSVNQGANWIKKKEIWLETPSEEAIWAFAFNSGSDKMFLGCSAHASIWVTDNGGETWTLSKDLSLEDPPKQTGVYAMVYDPISGNMVAGTISSAQVWVGAGF